MEQTQASREVTRRGFLAGAGAAVALAGAEGQAAGKALLPQRVLGRTKVRVPVLGLGTAPLGHRPEKEAVPFIHRCLDRGLTYLDTAPDFTGYADAQKHVGQVLKKRRDEVFLVTKCWEPDGEKALALLKKNLAELQTDHADLVYAHSIGDDRMVPEKVYGPNGVCRALEKAKRDGLTRFLGVSGHNRPGRFLQALKEWDFDVMMNAVSLVARHIYDFEEKVWPEAAKKGIGLAAMKVLGGSKNGEANMKGPRLAEDYRQSALRYALGLPASVVVVGIFDDAELKQNLEWLAAYKPLSDEERAALEGPTREMARAWGKVYGEVV